MAGSRPAVAPRAALALLAAALTAAGGLLAASCSSSGGDSAGAPATESPVVVDTVDVAASGLEGKVDRVIAMLPPDPGARRPINVLSEGDAVLGGRQLLRAPMADGTLMDLWVLRVRSPQAGGAILECRVMEPSDGSGASAGCGDVVGAGRPNNLQGLVRGGMSSERWSLMELAGPADMTHFIVTVGDQRIGVIPIDGQALLYLDGRCPGGMTVAARRGDEQLQEDPANFC